MRAVQVYVYKYEELSDRARKKALHNFQMSDYYPWADENKETLKAFENIFPIKVREWQYGGYGDYIRFDFIADYEIEELSGVRLATYIYNNYFPYLFKGKYYSKGKYVDGKYTYKQRYSKVMFDNSCVLTGYIIDDDILEPVYKFLKKPCKHTNFKDLMRECLEKWLSACIRDYEAYFSEENFMEMCESNGWEFFEDGKIA